MQANWSLILNVLLLLGVLITIGLLIKTRKQQQSLNFRETNKPSLGQIGAAESACSDDIIAVRKINQDTLEAKISLHQNTEPPKEDPQHKLNQASTLMLFLMAKEKRQFAGYELLQTVLAAGLRFGEEQLFHRHQFSNGQGPVLCSLAAATTTGAFDLQNIGAFSVRGLCLFMNASQNPGIDKERFSIMLDTAKQLSEGLDAHLLDDKQKPLTPARIEHYWEQLQAVV